MATTKNGPDAPTRLANAVTALTAGDYLAPIYYLKDLDAFLAVERQSEPTPQTAVATEELADGSLVVEPFRGQRFLGVVRILKRFTFAHFGWWFAGLLTSLL